MWTTEAIDYKSIGSRMFDAICSTGKSVEQFARSIGISRGTVYDWIKGKNLPSTANLIRVKEEYAISIDWILTGEGER